MRIAIVGGTGNEGRGLALRWARAGHEVVLGSRNGERARERAAELSELLAELLTTSNPSAGSGSITGGDNAWAIESAEVVVVSIPYSAHQATLSALASALAGKVVLDITVPLAPPKVRQVNLPAGQSAALEAQEMLGSEVRVTAALHHISALHLADLDHTVDCDVLVCGNDRDAREIAMTLVSDLSMRALDAGPLKNAIALEALTPVLLHLNRRYGSKSCGIRITGLPDTPPE